jgi:hypothetical protein
MCASTATTFDLLSTMLHVCVFQFALRSKRRAMSAKCSRGADVTTAITAPQRTKRRVPFAAAALRCAAALRTEHSLHCTAAQTDRHTQTVRRQQQ